MTVHFRFSWPLRIVFVAGLCVCIIILVGQDFRSVRSQLTAICNYPAPEPSRIPQALDDRPPRPQVLVDRDEEDQLLFTLTDPPSAPARIPLGPSPLSATLEAIIASFRPESAAVYDQLRQKFAAFAPLSESCGTWQSNYRSMHAEARRQLQNGTAGAPVPLTFIADFTRPSATDIEAGGLADRQRGLVSTFALALVINRPFFAYFGEPVPIESVFGSPSINWMWYQDTAPPVRNPREAGILERMNMYADFGRDLDFIFQDVGLDTFVGPADQVHSNQGSVLYILRERGRGIPAQRLRALGLTQENAYSCILDFLFRPLPSTRATIAAYSAVLSHPDVLSISVQIRTSDAIMRGKYGDIDLDLFRGYFICAKKLLSRDAHSVSHVVIHLSTDYQPLKEQFARDPMSLIDSWPANLPKPQPLLTEGRIRHSTLDAGLDLGASAKGFQAAILEQAIIDASDYRMLTAYSGFAQVSVLRSWPKLRPASTIVMARIQKPEDTVIEIPFGKTKFCDDPQAALPNIDALQEVREAERLLISAELVLPLVAIAYAQSNGVRALVAPSNPIQRPRLSWLARLGPVALVACPLAAQRLFA